MGSSWMALRLIDTLPDGWTDGSSMWVVVELAENTIPNTLSPFLIVMCIHCNFYVLLNGKTDRETKSIILLLLLVFTGDRCYLSDC